MHSFLYFSQWPSKLVVTLAFAFLLLQPPMAALAQSEKASTATQKSTTQEASEEGDEAVTPQRPKTSVTSDRPLEATERQGEDRRLVVSVAGNRAVRAILSNPFIPQTPKVRFAGSSPRVGVFGQLLHMSCEADNSLLVDASTVNDQGERQMGTWRVEPDGSILAEDVFQYAANDLSWVRRIPRYKFKDGSAIRANLPAGEKSARRIFDSHHDEVIYASSKYSGEGHVYLGSIFSLWRQNSQGQAKRLVSWSPVNTNIEKYGYSYDMKNFYSGQVHGLAVDNRGQIYLSLVVDDAAYSMNRMSRTSIYRVDEGKQKLVPVLDLDLEKVYATGKQANDSAFGNRVGSATAYYEDGPINKAFVGKVAVQKMCFDPRGNLYFLDNLKQAGGQVIRKIDLIKGEVTTWAY
jgi:hypothetical protein